MKNQLHKRIWFFALTLLVLQAVFVAPAFAHWLNGVLNPSPEGRTSSIQIGNWVWLDYWVKIYDPDATYAPGDIVYKPSDDGIGSMYIVDTNISPDDTYHDPDNPVTSLWFSMRYRTASKEYSGVNRYEKWDYVLYEGKTYRWKRPLNHDPNTLRQLKPDESTYYWELISDTELTDLWYRYNIYRIGDEVDYYGTIYRCIKEPCAQQRPDISGSEYWIEI